MDDEYVSLYKTGVRPILDDYLMKKAEERRDYGEYWSASSAGYCMRKVIFDRLQVPMTNNDPRKQRVFESGHIFHAWIQEHTKEAGLSVASENEIVDDKLMVKGHFDDLISINGHIIVYDYKTAHSRSFTYKKGRPMSYYHMMQLGTYLHILRELKKLGRIDTSKLDEARILTISKDDLRLAEDQLFWSKGLEDEVVSYWTELNRYWDVKKLPPCTCADREKNEKTGIGFMADERYNPYYFQGEPCSLTWYRIYKDGKADEYLKELNKFDKESR